MLQNVKLKDYRSAKFKPAEINASKQFIPLKQLPLALKIKSSYKINLLASLNS